MPTRMLREGIIDSRAVNELSEEAELFYRRLMSVVDDFGRCEADPEMLRLKCFPRRLATWTVGRLTSAMHETGRCLTDDGHPLVTYYQVGTKKYLEIYNFNQRMRSKKSRCPSPDGHPTVTRPADDGQMTAESTRARGRSETETETETEVNSAASGEQDLYDWFRSEYSQVQSVPEDLWRKWPSLINTPEQAAKLRKNLPLWTATKKFQEGFAPKAMTFLREGQFLHPPPASLGAKPRDEDSGPPAHALL